MYLFLKCGLKATFFGYQISGPGFDFIVYPGNIMSDNSETDHQYAPDQKQQYNNSGKAFLRCACEIPIQRLNNQADRA